MAACWGFHCENKKKKLDSVSHRIRNYFSTVIVQFTYWTSGSLYDASISVLKYLMVLIWSNFKSKFCWSIVGVLSCVSASMCLSENGYIYFSSLISVSFDCKPEGSLIKLEQKQWMRWNSCVMIPKRSANIKWNKKTCFSGKFQFIFSDIRTGKSTMYVQNSYWHLKMW